MKNFELGTEKLQEFEEAVRAISDFAFRYGIRKVGSFNPQSALEQERRKFMAACHEGYAFAQKRIVDQLLRIEADLRLTKNNIAEAHKKGNRSEIERLAERLRWLERRRMIFRRIADGMAWVLLGMRRWVVRRFFLGKQPPYLDAANLPSLIAEVDEINKDPLSFALITDITSFVQIGDILRVDCSKQPAQLSLIELKEGVVNAKVLGFLDMFYRIRGCPRAAWFFAQEEGVDALKQAQRVMKQQVRGLQLEQVIKTGKGIDPATGLPLLIPDEEIEEEDYDYVVRELVRACKEEGYAWSMIDDALWVGVFDTSKIAKPESGFGHLVYHSTRAKTPCLLFGSDEERQSELSELRKTLYRIIDLRQGLSTALSMPLFLRHIESETIFDIIFGRIVVLTYLDWERLFERAGSRGIVGRWSTKEAAKLKLKGYFTHLGKVPIFQRGDKEVAMGDGIIAKMQLDGITVDSIIKQIDAFLRLAESK